MTEFEQQLLRLTAYGIAIGDPERYFGAIHVDDRVECLLSVAAMAPEDGEPAAVVEPPAQVWDRVQDRVLEIDGGPWQPIATVPIGELIELKFPAVATRVRDRLVPRCEEWDLPGGARVSSGFQPTHWRRAELPTVGPAKAAGADTSGCSVCLRLGGKSYPRTCRECGLGPCKFIGQE